MSRLPNFLPRLGTILVVLVLGLILGRCFTPLAQGGGGGASSGTAAAAPTAWTCSMHPAIQAPTEGDCPICGMDLIPLEAGGGEGATGMDRTLRLDPGQKAMAGIRTVPVVRRPASHELRLVGKLAVDETELATLSAWVGGRLDRLYVDYTGLVVRTGDHMAEIYSPQLFHAQEELILAVESARRFGESADASLQRISHSTVVAARKKLTLYGLTEEQMEDIVARGEPSEQITLKAPMGGTVIKRHAVEGQYVAEGDPLYVIADLDHLWLELDAYESDLPWLRFGQEVAFEVDAWPGEIFQGTVSFLDPVLDPVTRTVHVRVQVDNEDGRLRPEMYARAKVLSTVDQLGHPTAVDLSGKWQCPMHPEFIADGAGECAICDMALETAESLGHVPPEPGEPPLLIPASAPLLTGDRAVVFVELAGAGGDGATVFEAREIELGPRAEDFFVVRRGLEEGDLVVARGAFVLDSEMQLRGQPSMMAAQDPGPVAEREESTPEQRAHIGAMLVAAVDWGEALASDDLPATQREITHMKELLATALDAPAPGPMAEAVVLLSASTAAAAREVTLDGVRVHYERLQAPLLGLATRYGYAGLEREVAIFHCPMAFGDTGADWFDWRDDGTRNPYFGASMLRCGGETGLVPHFDVQD
jgi:Cu(I)/Ag(I) efflux system membrane fusion protein